MRIQVSGINISCAHFIEIAGSFETLHGHNLSISAEVSGKGEGGLVMDFRELQGRLRSIVSGLDHRLLIPGKNSKIQISNRKDQTEIIAAGKRYLVPSCDLVILPLVNSTAEEIGTWIYTRLAKVLPKDAELSSVMVQEMEGKTAVIESS